MKLWPPRFGRSNPTPPRFGRPAVRTCLSCIEPNPTPATSCRPASLVSRRAHAQNSTDLSPKLFLPSKTCGKMSCCGKMQREMKDYLTDSFDGGSGGDGGVHRVADPPVGESSGCDGFGEACGSDLETLEASGQFFLTIDQDGWTSHWSGSQRPAPFHKEWWDSSS